MDGPQIDPSLEGGATKRRRITVCASFTLDKHRLIDTIESM